MVGASLQPGAASLLGLAAEPGPLAEESYARSVRFQYGVGRCRNTLEVKPLSLAELALSCGYVDQAHLPPDFVELSRAR